MEDISTFDKDALYEWFVAKGVEVGEKARAALDAEGELYSEEAMKLLESTFTLEETASIAKETGVRLGIGELTSQLVDATVEQIAQHQRTMSARMN